MKKNWEEIGETVLQDVSIEQSKLSNDDKTKIGQTVRKIRKEENMTQGEVANFANSDQSTVSTTESGRVLDQGIIYQTILQAEAWTLFQEKDNLRYMLSKTLSGCLFVPLSELSASYAKLKTNNHLSSSSHHDSLSIDAIGEKISYWKNQGMDEYNTQTVSLSEKERNVLGEQLSDILDNSGVTQEEVADAAGTTQPTVSMTLTGESLNEDVIFAIHESTYNVKLFTVIENTRLMTRVLSAYYFLPLKKLGDLYKPWFMNLQSDHKRDNEPNSKLSELYEEPELESFKIEKEI